MHDPAYTTHNADGTNNLLLICEHAGNQVPAPWENLGLDADALASHFAYDPGAAALTTALADQLNAPAILATYSRLLLDYNRPYWHDHYMRKNLDGPLVPGNARVDIDERTARENIAFHPLRREINGTIRRMLKKHLLPALVSVHTCTPVWHDKPRPWEVSILWRHDDRLVVPMLKNLRDEGQFNIGDNEPYDCREIPAFCLEYHAEPFRLPHFYLEVRNDICADPERFRQCVKSVAAALKPLLSN